MAGIEILSHVPPDKCRVWAFGGLFVIRQCSKAGAPLAGLKVWWWQRLLIRKPATAWPLYPWAAGEVLLLSVLPLSLMVPRADSCNVNM